MVTATLSDSFKQRIIAVLRKHDVIRAGIFGSVARGEARLNSDLDLLVELPPGKSLFDLSALALDLEDALGREVDLVTYSAINPRIRDRVLAEQVVLL